MKPRYKTIFLGLSIAVMSDVAFADTMNSETCAASLTPTGKAIYEAVAPSVEADTNLKELMKKKVRKSRITLERDPASYRGTHD